MESILMWLAPLIEQYASQYPVLATIIFVMGSFRLFLKPVMTIIQNVVDLTVTKSDDEFLAKVLENKVYLGLVFVIDWVASVKLPKKDA